MVLVTVARTFVPTAILPIVYGNWIGNAEQRVSNIGLRSSTQPSLVIYYKNVYSVSLGFSFDHEPATVMLFGRLSE
jgi:hypothetical protein